MRKFQNITIAAIAGSIALMVTTAASATQDVERPLRPTQRPHVIVKRHIAVKPAKAAATERPHWHLFDDFNARNATAAYSEMEWE